MTKTRFWPDSTQELLLGACLHRNASSAIASWKTWKGRVDLDDLNYSSFQIMSLAYLRLIELEIADPDLARIKGLHRYCWTQSKIDFRGRQEILKALEHEGIPTILLKGAALGATVYPKPSARSLNDTEIHVPPAAAARAVKVLEQSGWAFLRNVECDTAGEFAHPGCGEARLHWRFLAAQCQPGREEDWWGAARAFEYEQTRISILCPADQLLVACEQGMLQPPPRSPQWLVDCALLIRDAGVDWARLIDQSRNLQLSLHVRETLTYLSGNFEDSIPREVIDELARVPASLSNRIEYFLAGRPDARQHDLVHKFGAAACRYSKLKHGRLRQFRRDFLRLLKLLSRALQRRKEQTG